MMNSFRLFGMDGTKDFSTQVAYHLDSELHKHHEEYFADHECYVRSDVNVRNCDCYVIQSLYSDAKETVADKFTKLLFFIASLKDASARRVTAVIPYLAFARQDRKTESRAPITARYVAQLLESVTTDRVLTIDAHNLSAEQCSFRIPIDNLEAKNILADYVASQAIIREQSSRLVCLSPDSGGAGRTKRFRHALSARLGIPIKTVYLDKTHDGKIIEGEAIAGDVKNKLVVVIDDMVSSAATLVECNKAIKAQGGELWAGCATHPLFVGRINENLSSIDKVIVTDTIKPHRLTPESARKVHIISVARLFASAIRRTHDEGGSISDLLK